MSGDAQLRSLAAAAGGAGRGRAGRERQARAQQAAAGPDKALAAFTRRHGSAGSVPDRIGRPGARGACWERTSPPPLRRFELGGPDVGGRAVGG